MNRAEYFIYAIQNKLHHDRLWVKRAMMIPYGPTDPEKCGLGNDGDHHIAIIDGKKIELEMLSKEYPLYSSKDTISLAAGTFPNIIETMTTTVSQILINEYFFVYAFGDKVPFVRGKITGNIIDSLITPMLSKGVINVEEYFKYFTGANFATVFDEINVVASSMRAMTASKEVLILRDKLLKEYADRLDDPQVGAMIAEALAEADRAYLKGDVAEDWFTSSKMIDVVRMKLFALQGGIERLTGDGIDYVKTSLVDGYQPEDLPAIINQLRSGSYDRGASTGLGGYAAEIMSRIFQATAISERDCGVSIGKREVVKNNSLLLGRYIVGMHESLTAEDLTSLIGKEIILRDPTACITKNDNYCEVCMGDDEAKSKIGIQPRMMGGANVFLKISLAKFHGTAAKTYKIDPVKELR